MRSDLHEPGRGRLTSSSKTTPAGAAPLRPSAVDAALADESAPVVTQRGSRREFHLAGGKSDASRVVIDEPHTAAVDAPGDAGLIGQLSRQLNLLEAQQQQIRRLLELTERRFATR